MIKKITSYIFILTLLSSCAHTFMRGTVAKKLDSDKAIICLGKNEVKLGQKIEFFQTLCSGSASNSAGLSGSFESGLAPVGDKGSQTPSCSHHSIGNGKVIELINDHYSKVQTFDKIDFKEGTLVQIIK